MVILIMSSCKKPPKEKSSLAPDAGSQIWLVEAGREVARIWKEDFWSSPYSVYKL